MFFAGVLVPAKCSKGTPLFVGVKRDKTQRNTILKTDAHLIAVLLKIATSFAQRLHKGRSASACRWPRRGFHLFPLTR